MFGRMLRQVLGAKAPVAAPALLRDPAASALTVERSWQARHRLSIRFLRGVFGDPELHDGLRRSEARMLDGLHHRCLDQPLSADVVPRLPAVVPQFMQALREPRTSAEDLARILSGDTALVVDVLRLANSAAYSGGGRIGSLSQAVILLGEQGLRRLFLTAALRPIMDARQGVIPASGASRLWSRNQRAARAADYLARRRGVDRFPAFLTGLLSQVGLLVLSRALAENGRPALTLASTGFLVGLDALSRDVTARVCRLWDMPEAVRGCADALARDVELRSGDPLVEVVGAAELLACVSLLGGEECALLEAEGFGCPGIPDALAADCLQRLGESGD